MPAVVAKSVVTRRAMRAVVWYLAATGVLLLAMMALGLIMRFGQAAVVSISPRIFYELLSAHGMGLVAAVALGSTAIMWYFLYGYVDLSTSVFLANLATFVVGSALLLIGIFVEDYGGAYTYLYPLPAHAMGVWGQTGAALFLAGALILGTGFLLVYLDVGRAILTRYGSFGASFGWPQMLGKDNGDPPPLAIVAATLVVLCNCLGLIAGAVGLIIFLINLYVPALQIDALLAKNLIYFFSHLFINATIYMAVIATYELLPRYTGRPIKLTRAYLFAWSATALLLLIAFPHHLFMDYAMPVWVEVVGEASSYAEAIPVLAVTAILILNNVHRSGIRWDMASRFLYLSIFGWLAGIIPAVVDATIAINQVTHNTMWVDGHFHFYLMLGVVAMIFGFMYFLVKDEENGDAPLDRVAFWVYIVSSLGVVGTFLFSGVMSVPRRWAVHLPQWVPYDQVASIFGVFVVAAAALFVLRFLSRMRTIAV